MNSVSFVYEFSQEEVLALALFFRANEERMPDEAGRFYSQLEKYVYNSMTADEAERFFL